MLNMTHMCGDFSPSLRQHVRQRILCDVFRAKASDAISRAVRYHGLFFRVVFADNQLPCHVSRGCTAVSLALILFFGILVSNASASTSAEAKEIVSDALRSFRDAVKTLELHYRVELRNPPSLFDNKSGPTIDSRSTSKDGGTSGLKFTIPQQAVFKYSVFRDGRRLRFTADHGGITEHILVDSNGDMTVYFPDRSANIMPASHEPVPPTFADPLSIGMSRGEVSIESLVNGDAFQDARFDSKGKSIVVRGRSVSGHPIEVWFDSDMNFLPTRVAYKDPSSNAYTFYSTIVYDREDESSPVLMPTQAVRRLGNVDLKLMSLDDERWEGNRLGREIVHVTKAVVNEPIDSSVFRLPEFTPNTTIRDMRQRGSTAGGVALTPTITSNWYRVTSIIITVIIVALLSLLVARQRLASRHASGS